jgi:MoaA/NifB/PqqE/SkfB family radical SAM enzyme
MAGYYAAFILLEIVTVNMDVVDVQVNVTVVNLVEIDAAALMAAKFGILSHWVSPIAEWR